MSTPPPRRAGRRRWTRDAVRESADTAVSTATLVLRGLVVVAVVALGFLGFWVVAHGL